jgi:hypothetical protein
MEKSQTILAEKIISYLEGAHTRLGLIINDVKNLSTDIEFVRENIELNLPVVLNYIGLATKKANFDQPNKLALSMIPTYWKEVLEFPSSSHSL